MQTQGYRGDQILSLPPLLNWRDLHTVRHFPPNLVSMRMGNPEERPPTLCEGGDKVFLLWSHIGPRPSVSPSSQHPLPAWPTPVAQTGLWHVFPLESSQAHSSDNSCLGSHRLWLPVQCWLPRSGLSTAQQARRPPTKRVCTLTTRLRGASPLLPASSRMSGDPLSWNVPLSVCCEVSWFLDKG